MADILDTCGSVLDEACDLAREGAPAGTCVVAREQTAGRTRLGRVWESPAGGLYLAVVLRPKAPMGFLPSVATVAGLGAVDALRRTGASVRLAWPDDIVDPAGHKVGASVCAAGYGEGGVFVVAGIFVNLTSTDLAPVEEGPSTCGSPETNATGPLADLPSCGSPEPRTPGCLADLVDPVPPVEELADAVANAVMDRVAAWERGLGAGQGSAGPLGPVLSEWFDEMPLMGEPVRMVLPDGRTAVEGTLAGIDGWGRVTVRTDDGQEVELTCEQGSLRPR